MNVYKSVADAVRDICGAERVVMHQANVCGGDINDARSLTLDDGTILFMKSNTRSTPDNFMAEAEGLEAIRKTGKIGVPKVLGLGTNEGISFLILEFIAGTRRISDFWEVFAEELADMHGHEACCRDDIHDKTGFGSNPAADPETAGPGRKYGWPNDNWIGARKQINTEYDSWIEFFRDCRLKPQFDAADRYFSPGDRRKNDYLLSHLDKYLREPGRPSLVHGDLWAGNMITGNDGKGWLIDPAVYYGDPETDIAMTELFGGFSGRFYDAYRETGRLESGYEDRRDLYNLYHLLNHLNIFGGGYLPSVLRIVNRYSR